MSQSHPTHVTTTANERGSNEQKRHGITAASRQHRGSITAATQQRHDSSTDTATTTARTQRRQRHSHSDDSSTDTTTTATRTHRRQQHGHSDDSSSRAQARSKPKQSTRATASRQSDSEENRKMAARPMSTPQGSSLPLKRFQVWSKKSREMSLPSPYKYQDTRGYTTTCDINAPMKNSQSTMTRQQPAKMSRCDKKSIQLGAFLCQWSRPRLVQPTRGSSELKWPVQDYLQVTRCRS